MELTVDTIVKIALVAVIIILTGVIIFIVSRNKSADAVHWRSIIYMVFGFFTMLLIVGAAIKLFSDENILKHIGAAIIISWIVVLLGYYVWAIYFYNVNFGWQESDWKRNEEKAEHAGVIVTDDEPTENPHGRDSLGLPPGTVRGTIALTVLVTGMAITVSALSFPDRYNGNELIIDHFDFFKQAFLMMIAFYFGTKGLEILQGSTRSGVLHKPDAPSQSAAANSQPATQQPPAANATTPAPHPGQTENTPAAPEAIQRDLADPNAKG